MYLFDVIDKISLVEASLHEITALAACDYILRGVPSGTVDSVDSVMSKCGVEFLPGGGRRRGTAVMAVINGHFEELITGELELDPPVSCTPFVSTEHLILCSNSRWKLVPPGFGPLIDFDEFFSCGVTPETSTRLISASKQPSTSDPECLSALTFAEPCRSRLVLCSWPGRSDNSESAECLAEEILGWSSCFAHSGIVDS